MSADLNVFLSSFDTSGLTERHRAYNEVHSVLKRIHKRYFRFKFLHYASTILDARTIRLFTDYNAAIVHGDDLPELEPAFYTQFAKVMNDHDDSGFGWAYLENDLIVWDEKLTPADAESFCVLDMETTDNILGRDEVAVTKLYYANAERLKRQAEKREVKYANQRQEKKNLISEAIPDVNSKDARDSFANKRKILENAAAEAARKKQKGDNGNAVAGTSSAGNTVAMRIWKRRPPYSSLVNYPVTPLISVGSTNQQLNSRNLSVPELATDS
ncbi:hypothetical protein B0H13DRAFT_1924853 [Mycena leptocephala]|nr:hypothetical protein B0H13DRAFT_1924853 [Mycena leptocephala]